MRLFFAIQPSLAASTAIHHYIETQLKPFFSPSLNWIDAQKWHVTLYFLGDCSEIADLILSAKLALNGTKSFYIKCTGLISLPSMLKPRILALSIEPTQPLLELREKLGLAIQATGKTLESRSFIPHLTLGRNNTSCPLNLNQNFESIIFLASKLTLFESQISNSSVRYTPKYQFKLLPFEK